MTNEERLAQLREQRDYARGGARRAKERGDWREAIYWGVAEIMLGRAIDEIEHPLPEGLSRGVVEYSGVSDDNND